MGVYIKGMDMPEKGEYQMTLYVCSDGSAYIDVEAFPADEDKFELVSVPPHGRLIDADAQAAALRADLFRVEADNIIEYIDDIVPTIIPASEETED